MLAKVTDLDMELQQDKKTQVKQYEREKAKENEVIFPSNAQGLSLTLKKQPRVHEGPEKTHDET